MCLNIAPMSFHAVFRDRRASSTCPCIVSAAAVLSAFLRSRVASRAALARFARYRDDLAEVVHESSWARTVSSGWPILELLSVIGSFHAGSAMPPGCSDQESMSGCATPEERSISASALHQTLFSRLAFARVE